MASWNLGRGARSWPRGASWPRLGRVLAASWPRLGRVLAASWPRLGRVLAASWPLLGRVLAASWPLLGRAARLGLGRASWPLLVDMVIGARLTIFLLLIFSSRQNMVLFNSYLILLFVCNLYI